MSSPRRRLSIGEALAVELASGFNEHYVGAAELIAASPSRWTRARAGTFAQRFADRTREFDVRVVVTSSLHFVIWPLTDERTLNPDIMAGVAVFTPETAEQGSFYTAIGPLDARYVEALRELR